VLNLDSDEELSSELKDEIIKVIEKNEIDGLDIKIASKSLGSFGHPWSRLNRRIRFFRKAKGYYPAKLVHESIVVNGIIKKVKGFIYDYGTQDLEIKLKKINLYSSLRAKEKFENNKQPSFFKLIFIFPFAFVKAFILKRGFLNGVKGFITATNNAYYAFLKEAKLYELNKENESV